MRIEATTGKSTMKINVLRCLRGVLAAVLMLGSLLGWAESAVCQTTFLNQVGGFNFARGVAIDPTTGQVYVADTANDRIQRLEGDLTSPTTFATNAAPLQAGAFRAPSGVEFDTSSGDVLVATGASDALVRFDSTGTATDLVGSYNQIADQGQTGIGEFGYASDVVIHPTTGKIYVSEFYNGRVQRFDANFNYETQFGSFGTGPTQMANIYGLEIGPTGDVYVADFGNDRIQRYTADGTHVGEISLPGAGPTGLGFSANGLLYIAEFSGDRVTRYSSDGTFQQITVGVTRAFDVEVSDSGMVYVATANGQSSVVQRLLDVQAWVSGTNTFTNPAVGPTSLGIGSGQILGANFTLDAAKGLVVGGTTTVEADGVFTVAGGALTTDTLAINGGVFTTPDLSGISTLQFNSGDLNVNGAGGLTIGPAAPLGDTLTLTGSHTMAVDDTTSIAAGSSLTVNGGVLMTDTIALNGVGAEFSVISGAATFNNFTVENGAVETVANGQVLTVPQTVTVGANGTAVIDGGSLVASDVNVDSGGLLQVKTGPVAFTGTATSAGEIRLADATFAQILGPAISNDGTLAGSGRVGSALTNNATGEVRVAAGERMKFTGTSPHSNAGRVEVVGNPNVGGLAEIEFDAALTNQASTGLITAQSATLRFDDGLINPGSVGFSFGVSNVFGDVNNTGTVNLSGGAQVTFHDDVDQAGAMIIAATGGTISEAVVFGAFTTGGFTGGGNLFALGDLRLGNSPASIDYDGNLFMGPQTVTEIELEGTSVGEFDQLVVTGDLALNGTLDVSLLGAFTPTFGQSFVIASVGGELSGQFTGLNDGELVGTFGGTDLYIDYFAGSGNDVVLFSGSDLPGDFNNDGTVDAADYTTWRDNLGANVSLPNESTTFGEVTQEDYDTWRANFGSTAASLEAGDAGVPEPSAVVLMVLITIGFAGRLRQL